MPVCEKCQGKYEGVSMHDLLHRLFVLSGVLSKALGAVRYCKDRGGKCVEIERELEDAQVATKEEKNV